jgi:hypothetical protein
MPLVGWRRVELIEQLLEPVAVLRQVDHVGDFPRMGISARSNASASFSGVCPPNCTMTPCNCPARTFRLDDLEHVLGGERLEIKPVGGVVVGRDRLPDCS